MWMLCKWRNKQIIMSNDDEFVYANAKIRNEEKLLLVQKYHLKHENNAWYSERENSHSL